MQLQVSEDLNLIIRYAREEAMRMAVADAKDKAAILADAAGIGQLEIKAVQDGNVYSSDSGINNFSIKAMATEQAAGSADTFIRAAKISVAASVTIVFESK